MKPTALFAITLLGGLALAGAPAARQNDATDHRGMVIEGSPNVFINGRPAARFGDKVQCPVYDPFLGPHVGGPIIQGSTTVIINRRQAAKHGDIAQELSAQSRIIAGSANVLIGG